MNELGKGVKFCQGYMPGVELPGINILNFTRYWQILLKNEHISLHSLTSYMFPFSQSLWQLLLMFTFFQTG